MGAHAFLADSGVSSKLIAELERAASPAHVMLNWDCASATDTGYERAHNEDAICLNRFAGLMMIADGMGGYNAGEVASALAIEHAGNILTHELSAQASAAQVRDSISQAIAAANTSILAAAARRPECLGMGTTLAVATVGERLVTLGHVGDSRVYLFRNKHLARLTRDHSVGQTMVDSGVLDEQGARVSTLRGVLTRALGVEQNVDADLSQIEWQNGDRFLLCSDGLTDMVDDRMIASILGSGANAEDTARQLVQEALACGGYDNVSVVLAFSRTAPAQR